MKMTQEEIQQIVCDAGKRLLAEGYVSGTWGNISHRIDDMYMAITPSGRPYETMNKEEIVIVNYHDHTWNGRVKPSSEFKLHTEIYRKRKKIRAVIHTHQLYASVVAAAQREVPPVLDDMAQIIGQTVRCAEYAHSNTDKIVEVTTKALKGRYAALMANHGAVCIGRDMDEAFVVCQVLEKACRVFIEAEKLGGAKNLDKMEAQMMHTDYLKHYSKLKKPV
jgi:L-fuculose-phosphate aldolase